MLHLSEHSIDRGNGAAELPAPHIRTYHTVFRLQDGLTFQRAVRETAGRPHVVFNWSSQINWKRVSPHDYGSV